MNKSPSKRGGARAGAGRPSLGKGRYLVTLTQTNVVKAKAREDNFSGLLDRLLAAWLTRPAKKV